MSKKSQLEKAEDPDPPPEPPQKEKKPRTEKQIAATKALVARNKAKREEAKANKAKVDAMEKIKEGEVKEVPQVMLETKKPAKKVYTKVKKVKAPPPPPPPKDSDIDSGSDGDVSDCSSCEYETPPKPQPTVHLENPLSKPRGRVIRNTPPKPVNINYNGVRMPRRYRFPN